MRGWHRGGRRDRKGGQSVDSVLDTGAVLGSKEILLPNTPPLQAMVGEDEQGGEGVAIQVANGEVVESVGVVHCVLDVPNLGESEPCRGLLVEGLEDGLVPPQTMIELFPDLLD